MKAIRHFNFGGHTPTKKARLGHFARDCFTVVIRDCPDNSQLRAIIASKLYHPDTKIALDIGVARLHPTDQYNKKIGVVVANERAKTTYFNISGINFTPDGCHLSLTHKSGLITLLINNKSTYPEILTASSRIGE